MVLFQNYSPTKFRFHDSLIKKKALELETKRTQVAVEEIEIPLKICVRKFENRKFAESERPGS